MRINIFLALVTFILFSCTANSQSGKWSVLKTQNEIAGRSECGMAVVNNKLYLIGGDAGEALAVEALDLKTLKWTKLALAPSLLHHFQAVALKDKVYVLEAFSSGGFPNQEPMPNVLVYDTKTDAWKQGGEMPAARRRAGAAAVAYDDKLYLIAGIQHGHSSGTTNMFDVYDPETQKWSSLPDAPHIRDHCFASVIEDKLYVVGGRNTSFRDPSNKITFFSQTVTDVDCYDFKTGKWSTLDAKLPLGSGGGGVVSLDGALYYIGGERATDTEQNAPRKDVFRLNPITDKEWTKADTLHYARNGMAAVVSDHKIYIAGGSGGPGGGRPGMPPPNFKPANMPSPGDTSNRQGMLPQGPPQNMGDQKDNKIIVEVFRFK